MYYVSRDSELNNKHNFVFFDKMIVIYTALLLKVGSLEEQLKTANHEKEELLRESKVP